MDLTYDLVETKLHGNIWKVSIRIAGRTFDLGCLYFEGRTLNPRTDEACYHAFWSMYQVVPRESTNALPSKYLE